MADGPRSQNLILGRLGPEHYRLLAPHLEPVELPLRSILEKRGKQIDFAYFLERGFASVVANGASNPRVEVGLIGREGMTGLAVVLGSDRSPHDTYMQAGESGHRVTARKLAEAIAESSSLHMILLQWGHTFLVQTGRTAEKFAGCQSYDVVNVAI